MVIWSSKKKFGVKVPPQVIPSSAIVSVSRVPFSTVTSSLSKLVTASEKVIVTVEVSPVVNSSSDIMIVAVGAVVSTVMSRVPAALVLPAASVCVALRVSAPWPMAIMSAATSV